MSWLQDIWKIFVLSWHIATELTSHKNWHILVCFCFWWMDRSLKYMVYYIYLSAHSLHYNFTPRSLKFLTTFKQHFFKGVWITSATLYKLTEFFFYIPCHQTTCNHFVSIHIMNDNINLLFTHTQIFTCTTTDCCIFGYLWSN